MHACVHAQMLAGLPVTPSEFSEHKARVAAPFHTLCCGRVAGAALGAALKWHTGQTMSLIMRNILIVVIMSSL